MIEPDPTSAEAVARLRAVDTAPAETSTLPARTAARGKQAARRIAGSVVRRCSELAYRRLAATIEPRVRRMVEDAVHAEPALDQVRELAVRGVLDSDRVKEQEAALHATRVNLELLKGEVRHVQTLLDELGFAFAPATGLEGAGARFAELRESVFALERRLRNATAARPPAVGPQPDGGLSEEATTENGSSAERTLTSTLFDYVGFERRFRGDPEAILDTLVERYGELLADHQPVVDIGCGRGELLGRLAERGVDVIGIEPDPGMAAEARDRGITVHEELAGDWLRSVPDGSLGSMITTHVLEHLELDDMIELLELAVTKLRPDAVFISETPNPASLIVLGNSYLLDPTHVRPLHPSLLSFLCEKAGFRDIRLQFFSPATGYHLPLVELEGDDNVPAWAATFAGKVNEGFSRLNEVLFGPQDYAVVARTAPAASA